jgi:hypothetical protein
MPEPQPRYEYRVWSEGLGTARDDLYRRFARLGTEISEETYLIPAAVNNCNAKIRAGRMNIKVLLTIEQGLELWKPTLDAEFPLDRSLISGQIFTALEMLPPNLPRERYSIEEFVMDVVRPQSRIVMVALVKERTRFRLDESLAEYTSVTMNNLVQKTVAVESVNPAAVWQLVYQLGIAGIPNTSYVRQLKQLLGIA